MKNALKWCLTTLALINITKLSLPAFRKQFTQHLPLLIKSLLSLANVIDSFIIGDTLLSINWSFAGRIAGLCECLDSENNSESLRKLFRVGAGLQDKL